MVFLRLAVLLSLFVGSVLAAPTTPPPAAVPKWARFELTFQTSISYPNPPAAATLTVTFVSPLGEMSRVEGFWDGDKTWRARFSPNMPGNWRYFTACSDAANTHLDKQTGGFTCVAPLTRNALDQRGPIRVSRDRRHFEHADRTPFLWFSDVASNGARMADTEAWRLYSTVRAAQKFTVSQFVVSPGTDAYGESAFIGGRVNVKFFKRLDEKINALNDAGMVAAIVPLQEFGTTEAELPESEAALLLRYAVARWGANKVAWIVAVESDAIGKKIARWTHIGRSVFENVTHAPVILVPGETHWLLDEFREEEWVDAFGFSNSATGEDALQWMLAGPLSVEWMKSPTRPILSLSAPPESTANGEDARRMLWWSLLMNPSAGASYSATAVANWETNIVNDPNMVPRAMPAWRNALFSPGARSIAPASEFLSSIDFASLRPASRALSLQPGLQSPSRHVAAAANESQNLTLVYVPQDRAVEISLGAMPKSPTVNWFNASTGDISPAVAALKETSCQFATPRQGDWLLVVKAGK